MANAARVVVQLITETVTNTAQIREHVTIAADTGDHLISM